MSMTYGKLYLIPSPLGDCNPAEVIPAPVLEKLKSIGRYVVEEVRTARRYLSIAGLKGQISGIEFYELNEHTDPMAVEGYLDLFKDGNDVGLISEAGLPAVADPGALLVSVCLACHSSFPLGYGSEYTQPPPRWQAVNPGTGQGRGPGTAGRAPAGAGAKKLGKFFKKGVDKGRGTCYTDVVVRKG